MALGSMGNPHIQEKISVLDPRPIWLDQLRRTLLWPQGITMEMGIRDLAGSEMWHLD